MLIVTARAGDEPVGCLVGFATQCSIEPARFLVCLSDKNHTYRAAEDADALAVHVIPEDRADLARLFGGETQDETDKFSRCRWEAGPEGLPILEDCPRWFAGRVVDVHRLGDHVGFVLDPFAASADGEPASFLSFQQAKAIDPGHEA
jgi:flavin reductase (DIM6/NTAB) family NADH-FMN oxidoreductase RutF